MFVANNDFFQDIQNLVDCFLIICYNVDYNSSFDFLLLSTITLFSC